VFPRSTSQKRNTSSTKMLGGQTERSAKVLDDRSSINNSYNMPRGPQLSDFEKGQIIAFDHAYFSRTAIAEQLNRSRNLFSRLLGNVNGYGKRKRTGRPKKLTEAAKRRLIRAAGEGVMGSKQLVKALQLPVKARRVRQVLAQVPHLRYKRIQRTPAMKPRHKSTRLE